MADQFQIVVKLDVNAEGLKQPITETVPASVSAVAQTKVDVPADGKVHEVAVMPPTKGAPAFLMIRPTLPDAGKLQLDPAKVVEYATAQAAVRRPLRGTHVFFNGMSEWLTTGSLESLYFWNNLAARKDAKAVPPEQLVVSLQILVGYEPEPAPAAAAHGDVPAPQAGVAGGGQAQGRQQGDR